MSENLIISMLITAISALGGGFMGAVFARQTQHHKWLLERRAEAFSKFLQLVNEAHFKATEFLYDRELQNYEREQKVLEAYQPALNQARIVRLYLPKKIRNEFYDKAKEYWALHSSVEMGSTRLTGMEQRLQWIQEIFEKELSPYFWLRPLGRWWKTASNQ